tara:strand:+ start:627 stop:896 length:270 start_codon:yes stop_codon:yes gene_type:complete
MYITLYIDIITLVMALMIIGTALRSPKADLKIRVLASVASMFYLYAQTGWAASYVSGNVWGALFNNYIWFIFNFTSFVLMFVVLKEPSK